KRTQKLAGIVAPPDADHGRRDKGTEGTEELAVACPRNHCDHGHGTEGVEGTQEPARIAPLGHPDHRRGAKGIEGAQELADLVALRHQGHARGGTGTQGSTAWAEDFSSRSRALRVEPGPQDRRATRLNPEGGFPVERVGLAGSESNATTCSKLPVAAQNPRSRARHALLSCSSQM